MIKLALITITVFIFSFHLKSQSYDNLLDTGKLWSTVDDYLFTSTNSYYTKFGEDTLIAGKTYKKIIESTDINLLSWNLRGYAREDTNKRVYFMNLSGIEGLVYDFDVNIGDTIDFYNPFSHIGYFDTTIVVVNVDSVFYGNTIRKVIDVAQYGTNASAVYGVERWIEGIGSFYGILENGYMIAQFVGWYNRLLCYHKNDSLIYQNPAYNKCFFDADINEFSDKNLIKIYPNPAKEYIIVKFPTNIKETTVEIRDVMGRLLIKEDYSDYISQKQIDISALKTGVYYISVITKEIITTKIIIKNK